LKAGIGHGQRIGPRRHLVPGQHGEPARRAELLGIEAEFTSERVIQAQKPGCSDGCRRKAREEPIGKSRIAVFEGNG
jgi:hypothetical protein